MAIIEAWDIAAASVGETARQAAAVIRSKLLLPKAELPPPLYLVDEALAQRVDYFFADVERGYLSLLRSDEKANLALILQQFQALNANSSLEDKKDFIKRLITSDPNEPIITGAEGVAAILTYRIAMAVIYQFHDYKVVNFKKFPKRPDGLDDNIDSGVSMWDGILTPDALWHELAVLHQDTKTSLETSTLSPQVIRRPAHFLDGVYNLIYPLRNL